MYRRLGEILLSTAAQYHRMLGFLKNLLSKRADDQAAAPAPPPPPPAREVKPSAPAPVAPAPKPPPRPIASVPAGPVVQVSLKAVVAKLPPELQALVVKPPGGSAEITLSLDKVLPQLSQGAVKITFGELCHLAGAGVFSGAGDQGQAQVEIPLSELLPKLKPEFITRRANQRKVDVPDDVTPLFGPRGSAVSQPKAVSPAPAVAPPAAPRPVPTPAAPPPPPPAPVTPPPPPPPPPPPVAVVAEPAPPPAPPPTPAPEPEAEAPIKPSFSLPDPASLRPTQPVAPKPITPAPLKPPTPAAPKLPSATPLPQPSAALPKPPPAPLPKPPPPPAPVVAPVAPPPAPAASVGGQNLSVSLASVLASLPEALQQALSGLTGATVEIPSTEIELGMRRGKVAFAWKELHGWIKPPPPVDAIGADTEVVLPLRVIAPLFMALNRPARQQRKVVVGDNIPDMFSGKAPAPVAAPPPAPVAPVAPAPVPVAAPPLPPPPPPPPVSSLGVLFGEPGKTSWTPVEIVRKAAVLRGVSGALIATPDGLLVAAQLPGGLNAETFAAFVPQIFNRVGQYTKEMSLGELGAVTATVSNVPLHVFKAGAVYFAALGKAGEQAPADKFPLILGELARRHQK